MEWVAIVIILSLMQYFAFAFAVAGLREKLQIPATERTDNEQLVRAVRVHANTGEMLIVFIPLVTLCGLYLDGRIAAGIGAFWIVARFVYRRGYLRDVKGRIPGFLLGDAVLGLLTVGSLFGIGRSLLAG